MSIALVIKNSNFAANSLGKVNFTESVPCTAVAVNKSSVTFNTVEQSETIVVTVTPTNTTDSVIITSSDENVVTVNNKTLSFVGIGTATVTVKCGTKTTEIAVNATSVSGKQLVKVDGYTVEQYSWNDPHSMRAIASSTYSISAYQFVDSTRNSCMLYGENAGVEAISIPKGTTTVRIASASKTGFSFDRVWFGKIGGSILQGVSYASAITKISKTDTSDVGRIDMTVPDGCDCFSISATTANIASDFTVTFM